MQVILNKVTTVREEKGRICNCLHLIADRRFHDNSIVLAFSSTPMFIHSENVAVSMIMAVREQVIGRTHRQIVWHGDGHTLVCLYLLSPRHCLQQSHRHRISSTSSRFTESEKNLFCCTDLLDTRFPPHNTASLE
ncbi:hypothetical protein KIN20_000881 [Parelaphostrongylus tenuis]|uniref:Uncharacterized protein n=1 Tax=Parelaphostrongylus tenuis TaxID=148309 RepID=A0AAD5QE44_PARTN|nr:hypothetical protein KIN20_000881 [Parelaphostrongylus tenuis]